MGHRDTQMMERVYGRLWRVEIGALLSAHLAGCITGVADKLDLAEKWTEWTFADRSAQGRNRTTDTGIFRPCSGVANSA